MTAPITQPINDIELSLADVIAAIAELAARAARPGDAVYAALLHDLAPSSGVHPASLARLTALWAAAWQQDGLERCVRRAGLDRGPWQPLGRVAVVAPGNLCVATWQAVLEPLLAGNRVRVRPGSGDPHAADRLRDALALIAPALAERIEVDAFVRGDVPRWRRFLADAEALAVHGGNEAVAAVLRLAGEAGFAGRVRCHGDLQSCAVVTAPIFADPEAFQAFAQDLAHDALLADGRGCMSPRALYALGDHDADRWHAAHRQLAFAMDATAAALPAGRLSPALVAHARLDLEAHAFAAAQHCATQWFSEGAGWWLATERQAGRAPAASLGPACRGLIVRGLADWPAWVAHLHVWRGRLSTVAVAGEPDLEALAALAVPRLCQPGQMQAPPADRSPDGHLPLVDFVRWLDR